MIILVGSWKSDEDSDRESFSKSMWKVTGYFCTIQQVIFKHLKSQILSFPMFQNSCFPKFLSMKLKISALRPRVGSFWEILALIFRWIIDDFLPGSFWNTDFPLAFHESTYSESNPNLARSYPFFASANRLWSILLIKLSTMVVLNKTFMIWFTTTPQA